MTNGEVLDEMLRKTFPRTIFIRGINELNKTQSIVFTEEWLKMPSVQPEQRWIPVSEGLPEDGQNVLFCDIDDDIMIGYHIKGRPYTHFSQDGTYEDIKGVIAWMPLPEPYKAESEAKDEDGD